MKRRTCIAAGVLAAAAACAQEGLRVDDRRPDAPASIDLFGRRVLLTGSWEYSDERRTNFDLDAARNRDRRVREHELKLEARSDIAPGVEAFVQALGLHETRRTQGSSTAQRTHALERGQAWLRWQRLLGPCDLQAGRVALIDRRAFWWDDDLDAVRLQCRDEDLRADVGLARQLARVSSAESGIPADARGVWRAFGQAEWRWDRRHRLEAFWLRQHDASSSPAAGTTVAREDDADASDLSATWLGLRASGEWRSGDEGARLLYRADAAVLRGRERVTPWDEGSAGFTAGTTSERAVRGHAHDVGATVVLPWPLRPSLGVAHARGSPGFRQTGLQENKGRLAGVKRLRVYGELLQPDLANLSVATWALGLRLAGNTSLELLQHRYRQPRPADGIAGARLSPDPLGASGDIGTETDLVLALREWRALELTLRWSRLHPGEAFAANRRAPARALELGVAVNF